MTQEETKRVERMYDDTTHNEKERDEMRRGKKSRHDMLGISWSSLGSCMEIAGASDAEWLLMLDISRCPSQDGHKPQDLRLLWLDDA